MNVQDYKTILVLFEPKQGGNHFANMMSTSPKIQDRLVTADYQHYLLEQYRQPIKHVHFGELSNVEVHNQDKLISTIQSATLPVVICGHISESYHVLESIKQQGPLGIINFENYKLSGHVLARMRIDSIRNDITDLLEWAHRADVVSKTFGVDSEDMFNIETNWLFQHDITSLLDQLNLYLGLELDIDFCKILHSLWVEKVMT